MSITPATSDAQAGLARGLHLLAVAMAYIGGTVVAGIGIMSAISIIGRAVISRPITGDFELVELGTAFAGTMFLPFCQMSGGHIVVDIFTMRASERTREWLDRFGALLMAVMFIAVAWRAMAGSLGLRTTGESSMLLGFPTWVGYASIVPGVFIAGIVALAQSLGLVRFKQAELPSHE